MMTTDNISKRIELAAQWLDNGSFSFGQGYRFTGGIHPEIRAERSTHSDAAAAYATEKTGYVFHMMTMLSDDHTAWQIIKDCEYNRLEAAARERRILALAALIEEVK